MIALSSARNLKELKTNYRKLAAQYHPDRGGNVSLMQAINEQYQNLHSRLKSAANDHQREEDFSHLSAGDSIYVNGTLCEVLEVTEYYFRVLASGRNRQAQMCKTSGRGRFNPRLRASYRKNDRAFYYSNKTKPKRKTTQH